MARRWQLQDAKARFSELVDATLREGPQVVTRRGVEEAVLVSIVEWRRLEATAGPGLKALLLAETPREVLRVPARGKRRRRAVRRAE